MAKARESVNGLKTNMRVKKLNRISYNVIQEVFKDTDKKDIFETMKKYT